MTGGLVALLVAGSFLGGACSWALLTRLAYRLPREDDGGPEADRLIADAMAVWRADVARRIVARLVGRGLGFPLDLQNKNVAEAIEIVESELRNA